MTAVRSPTSLHARIRSAGVTIRRSRQNTEISRDTPRVLRFQALGQTQLPRFVVAWLVKSKVSGAVRISWPFDSGTYWLTGQIVGNRFSIKSKWPRISIFSSDSCPIFVTACTELWMPCFIRNPCTVLCSDLCHWPLQSEIVHVKPSVCTMFKLYSMQHGCWCHDLRCHKWSANAQKRRSAAFPHRACIAGSMDSFMRRYEKYKKRLEMFATCESPIIIIISWLLEGLASHGHECSPHLRFFKLSP